MKIAIPVNEQSILSDVCISFGRAPYFMFLNTETHEQEFVLNTAADAHGGAGIMASQMLVDNNIDTLLTPRCGENAVEVLNLGNIKIFKTISTNIKDTIASFEKGELSILTDIHSGFHGAHN